MKRRPTQLELTERPVLPQPRRSPEPARCTALCWEFVCACGHRDRWFNSGQAIRPAELECGACGELEQTFIAVSVVQATPADLAGLTS